MLKILCLQCNSKPVGLLWFVLQVAAKWLVKKTGFVHQSSSVHQNYFFFFFSYACSEP